VVTTTRKGPMIKYNGRQFRGGSTTGGFDDLAQRPARVSTPSEYIFGPMRALRRCPDPVMASAVLMVCLPPSKVPHSSCLTAPQRSPRGTSNSERPEPKDSGFPGMRARAIIWPMIVVVGACLLSELADGSKSKLRVSYVTRVRLGLKSFLKNGQEPEEPVAPSLAPVVRDIRVLQTTPTAAPTSEGTKPPGFSPTAGFLLIIFGWFTLLGVGICVWKKYCQKGNAQVNPTS
jgi:hypothetical protein